uniref:Methyltransferase domain-containing protein n=1 Tax=Lotharella oceanica TaxID=641309 RepID=A0A7S2TPF7_9EUKA|mmetsp:Transcript_23606/g.44086  ORF Transcript_23606/g.44086 Transcript_23606/m.44086 type:complete len:128 (+) Transcript_23606:2-385(+)
MVGVHLCGTLSEVAVREFNRNPGIRALVLCPCCMPKKAEGLRLTTLSRRLNQAASAYQLWCWTVFHQIDRRQASCDLLQDQNMITLKKSGAKYAKNNFIYARRFAKSHRGKRHSGAGDDQEMFCQRC